MDARQIGCLVEAKAGSEDFMINYEYHLQAIELTKEIGKVYKLSKRNVGDK